MVDEILADGAAVGAADRAETMREVRDRMGFCPDRARESGVRVTAVIPSGARDFVDGRVATGDPSLARMTTVTYPY